MYLSVRWSQTLQLFGPVLNQHQIRRRRRCRAFIDEEQAPSVSADVVGAKESGRCVEENCRVSERELTSSVDVDDQDLAAVRVEKTPRGRGLAAF